MSRSVIVAGDLITEVLIGVPPDARQAPFPALAGIAQRRDRGGAWWLAELATLACADLPDVTVTAPARGNRGSTHPHALVAGGAGSGQQRARLAHRA